MKSPIVATALMGLIALVATVAAIWYYPWPRTVAAEEIVNQPLFEDYDYNQVRTLEIARYNPDTNNIERIELRRSGEKWVIPAKDNFVATESSAITNAVNSLNGRTVLEVMSDQQQDHFEYGVVEPEDYQAVSNLSGLGTRITLSDRNNQEIASLVVGKGRRNDPQQLKRFVRRPGQPQVYVIDYDASVLNTDFPFWVNANLMNLQTRENPVGQRPAALTIENYRLESEDLDPASRQLRYEVEIDVREAFNVSNLTVPGENGEGVRQIPATDQQKAELGQLGRYIANLQFTDVERKEAALAQALRLRKGDAPADVWDRLLKYGFRLVGVEDGELQLVGQRGALTLLTSEGIRMEVLVGKMTGNLNEVSGKPDRYVMLTADVDEEFFPEPEKPTVEDAESEENRAYLRAVDERNNKIRLARDVANAMNATFADWYYVMDESIVEGLIPEIVAPPVAVSAAGD